MNKNMLVSDNANNATYVETFSVGSPAWFYSYESEEVKSLVVVAIERLSKENQKDNTLFDESMVDYEVCREFVVNGINYNIYLATPNSIENKAA